MKTVVCLHGFTGSTSSWDAVLAELPSDAVGCCPAIVGHDPELPLTGRRFEDEVDRLAGCLLRKDGGSLHLAGYSMGSRLALGLLVRYPQGFAAATLIGVHPGLASEDERRERRAADEVLAGKVVDEGVERFVDHWQRLPLFRTQDDLPQALLDGQRRQRLCHRADGLAHSLRVLGLGQMPTYRDDLARLGLPIRLMVGERDDKFRQLAMTMVAKLPRGEVEVVPGAGHNLLLEAPCAVAAAIVKNSPSGPRSP